METLHGVYCRHLQRFFLIHSWYNQAVDHTCTCICRAFKDFVRTSGLLVLP